MLKVPGFNIDHPLSGNGETALMIVAKEGYEDATQTLLDNNAQVNQGDKSGKTALHWAAEKGHAGIVDKLLNIQGIDVNKADDFGWTALHLAAEKGHAGIVDKLLNIQGIDVNKVDNNGWTALHRAAREGHAEIVDKLLNIQESDVNKADRDGWTALYWAAEKGYAEIVDKLLNIKGIDVNKADNFGWTALHLAAEKGHAGIVDKLLNIQGIDVNKADNSGRTALHWAAKEGHSEAVEKLLSVKEVSVNVADKEGYTVLDQAIDIENVGVLVELLKSKRLESDQYKECLTLALSLLIQDRRYDVEKLIKSVENGDISTINESDVHGNTLLHHAAEAGDAVLVDMLINVLKENIDININQKNVQGKTAFDLASEKRHYSTIIVLLKAGAQVDNWDVDFLADYFCTITTKDAVYKIKNIFPVIFEAFKSSPINARLKVISKLVQIKRNKERAFFDYSAFTIKRNAFIKSAFDCIRKNWNTFKSYHFKIKFDGEDGHDGGGLTQSFVSELANDLQPQLSGKELPLHEGCMYSVEKSFFKQDQVRQCYNINLQVGPEDLSVALRMMLLVRMHNYRLPSEFCEESLFLLFGDVNSVTKEDLREMLMRNVYFDPYAEYETVDSLPKGLPFVGFDESKFVDDGGEVDKILSNQTIGIDQKAESMSEIFSNNFRARILQVQEQLMKDINDCFADVAVFLISELFHSPQEWGQLFTDSTLTSSQSVDTKAFAEHFECEGSYCNEKLSLTGICKTASHFECFKEIIEHIGNEDQTMLLKLYRFVSGASMFPAEGLVNAPPLTVYFTKNQAEKGGIKRAPTASTCAKTIYFEVRDTDEEMERALLYSLNNYGDAFTLV